MTALLNAAHHALAFTAPVPEAAMDQPAEQGALAEVLNQHLPMHSEASAYCRCGEWESKSPLTWSEHVAEVVVADGWRHKPWLSDKYIAPAKATGDADV